jgi:electron transport complex protein RnfC
VLLQVPVLVEGNRQAKQRELDRDVRLLQLRSHLGAGGGPVLASTIDRACDDLGVRVDRIINDYPQADPTLLMYTMLGRRLRPGRLPTDQGAVLLDAAAAVAVGRFALSDEPLRCAPLAVRDHVSNQSCYVAAPLGMTLAELLERLGMPWQDRILRGGDLLRDVRVAPDARVGCGELIYHSSGLSAALVPASCIRCGWCVDACPTNVQPATALEAAQRRDPDMAENAGIEACIECGICSYVCPSHLPLLEGIRQMKRLVHEEYRSDDATTG